MEPVGELIFVMMSLVFLLMGVVLVASILMSAYNPYDQIVFANVEKLRSAMNEACFSGGEVTVSFDMPQNTPILSGFFTILPAWVMRSAGDPNYVLYYESFPPGEAIGWEVYHSTFKDRIVTYLPSRSEWKGKTERDVLDYVYEIYKEAKTDSSEIDAIVVGNIILDDEHRSDFVVNKQAEPDQTMPADGYFLRDYTETEKTKKGFFGYGEWEGNAYKFHNYLGLTPLEKTLVKYQACGDNSLCLKTRSGVYRFPLGNCKDADYIQLVYDARDKIDVKKLVKDLGISIGSVLTVWFVPSLQAKFLGIIGLASSSVDAKSHIIGTLAAIKGSEFYTASPCSISEVKVSMNNNCAAGPTYICKKMQKYPLFEYDEDDKLKYVGEHYFCLDSVIDVSQDTGEKPSKCLTINIYDKPNGYCWTPDLSNREVLRSSTKQGLWGKIKDLILDTLTYTQGKESGMFPVAASTAYINQLNSFVLLPPQYVNVKELKMGWLINLWSWP